MQINSSVTFKAQTAYGLQGAAEGGGGGGTLKIKESNVLIYQL
jgi:hypothetical protein